MVKSLLKGNVQVVTVRSLGLVGNILEDSPDRKVSVYLPPGYEANPQKRYPVLYLYMGYGYKHDAWFGGVDRNYDMSVVLDNLINQGKLNEFIVVSPDNYNKYYGSWFTNSNMSGSWEDFNAIDVVKYIDENFRTIPKPESRGISGWSMGGYGAVKLAMKYPETFSCLYSISGALLDFQHRLINLADEKKDFITAAKLTTINSSITYCYSIAIAFAPDKNAVGYGAMPVDTSGVVIDSVWQKYLAHDLASKIPDYKQNLLKLNKIVLECGTQEPPIYNENNSFSTKLKEYGINHLLNIHSGDHSYTINNRMDTHVFPFFSLNLANYEIGMNEMCYIMNDT
ncbi:MAG TPA: alpha/beta hydrolase-fold protein, partial [Draconibacterium sp.]|nr:alpha/beta hydrolase-fold protein [Draconibacterium sp.]